MTVMVMALMVVRSSSPKLGERSSRKHARYFERPHHMFNAVICLNWSLGSNRSQLRDFLYSRAYLGVLVRMDTGNILASIGIDMPKIKW
jgi:hypothetical protein